MSAGSAERLVGLPGFFGLAFLGRAKGWGVLPSSRAIVPNLGGDTSLRSGPRVSRSDLAPKRGSFGGLELSEALAPRLRRKRPGLRFTELLDREGAFHSVAVPVWPTRAVTPVLVAILVTRPVQPHPYDARLALDAVSRDLQRHRQREDRALPVEKRRPPRAFPPSVR